jgi:hypothetical protein
VFGAVGGGGDCSKCNGCCMCDPLLPMDTTHISATHEFIDDVIVRDNLYVAARIHTPRVEVNDGLVVYNRTTCHSWKMFVTEESDLAFGSKQGTLVTLCEEFATGLLNFTGSHLVHVHRDSVADLVPGHIVVSTGVYKDVVHDQEGLVCMDDALPIVALSESKGDARAFGVFSRWERSRCFRLGNMRFPLPSSSFSSSSVDLAQVNSAGEGCILVNGEGGDLRNGDLVVCSSTRGVGCRQADDIVRSSTVAKVTGDCVFVGGEARLVGCIYKF